MVYTVASKLQAVIAAAFFGWLAYHAVRRFITDRSLGEFEKYLNHVRKSSRDTSKTRRHSFILRQKARIRLVRMRMFEYKAIVVLVLPLALPVLVYYLGPLITSAWQNLVRNTLIAALWIVTTSSVLPEIITSQWPQITSAGMKLIGGLLVLRAFFLERECARLQGVLSVTSDETLSRFRPSKESRLLQYFFDVLSSPNPRTRVLYWILDHQLQGSLYESDFILDAWRKEFPPHRSLDRRAVRDADKVQYDREVLLFSLDYFYSSAPARHSDEYLSEKSFDIANATQTKLKPLLEQIHERNLDADTDSKYWYIRSQVEKLTGELLCRFAYWQSYLNNKRERLNRTRVQLYVAGFLLATVFSPLPEAIAKLFSQ